MPEAISAIFQYILKSKLVTKPDGDVKNFEDFAPEE